MSRPPDPADDPGVVPDDDNTAEWPDPDPEPDADSEGGDAG